MAQHSSIIIANRITSLSDLPGLVQYTDMDRETFAENSFPATLTDLSGTNRPFTQATAANAAKFYTHTKYGKVLEFTAGSSHFYNAPEPLPTNPETFTLFLLGSAGFGMGRGMDGAGTGWSIAMASTTAGIVADGAQATITPAAASGMVCTALVKRISQPNIGPPYGPRNIQVYTNGIRGTSAQGVGVTLRSSTVGLTLGRMATAGNFYPGLYKKSALFNRWLTDVEIDAVNTFLIESATIG